MGSGRCCLARFSVFVLVGRFVGGVLGRGCCRGGLVGSEMIWLFVSNFLFSFAEGVFG